MTEPKDLAERFRKLDHEYRKELFWDRKPSAEEVKAKVENIAYHNLKDSIHRAESICR